MPNILINKIKDAFNDCYQLITNNISAWTVLNNFIDDLMDITQMERCLIISHNETKSKLEVANICYWDPINEKYTIDVDNSILYNPINKGKVALVQNPIEDFIFPNYKLKFAIGLPLYFGPNINGVIWFGSKNTIDKNLVKHYKKIGYYGGFLINACLENEKSIKHLEWDTILTHNFSSLFMKNTSEGVIICNENLSIKFINLKALSMIGLDDKNDVLGRELFKFIPDIKNHIGSYLDIKEPFEIIFQSDERASIFEMMINSIMFHQQKYYMFMLHNITQKELSHQRDIIRKKNDFIAFLSHELRNPLQSVIMVSKILSSLSSSNNQFSRYYDIIKKAGNEMKKIINDVLDLGKIDAGEMSVECEQIVTKDIIDEVYNNYSEIAKEKKLHLFYQIKPDVPEYFYSDYLRVSQILSNVVSNAIKYSKKGSIEIKVTFDGSDGIIKFSIADQGIGIKENDIEKLFQEYSQFSSTEHKLDSTGLGLNISRKLAHLLNGELTVESEYMVGSTFHFMIPFNNKDMKLCDSITDLSSIDIGTLYGKILIVEDNITNLMLLEELLDLVGKKYAFDLRIVKAKDGLEAIDQANANKDLDLILMDINMDRLDGSQACSIIKKKRKKLPIIALTGNIYAKQDDVKIKKKYSCFNEVLLKPCSETKIIKVLTRYLPKIPELTDE